MYRARAPRLPHMPRAVHELVTCSLRRGAGESWSLTEVLPSIEWHAPRPIAKGKAEEIRQVIAPSMHE
eukprot:2791073-Pleurochrysis_carterae.AAC.1